MITMVSRMYRRGYDLATLSFTYIPDFKNKKEKQEFERGLKDGYNARKKDNVKKIKIEY
jgi:hypothetical protein